MTVQKSLNISHCQINPLMAPALKRSKAQKFMHGVKFIGRVIGCVLTLGASEVAIRKLSRAAGASVSSRAKDSITIGMNPSLMKKMSKYLGGAFLDRNFATVDLVRNHLGEVPARITQDIIGSIHSVAVKDFKRAHYFIQGEEKRGMDALEGIVELCKDENGRVDHDLLRKITTLANQGLLADMMKGPALAFLSKNPLYIYKQHSKNPSPSYSIEKIINSKGEVEFILKAGVNMELTEGTKPIAEGALSVTIRLKKQNGYWKIRLEDYHADLTPIGDRKVPSISGKEVGEVFRSFISEDIGKPVAVSKQRQPLPDEREIRQMFTELHSILDRDPEVAALRTNPDAHTIFRTNTNTTRSITDMMKRLSVNYVHDVLDRVIDYVNNTGPIELRPDRRTDKGAGLSEDQQKLAGLLDGLMASLIGGKRPIQERVDAVPQEICDMCKTIFTRLIAAGASEQTAKNGVTNFLFLRTLGPALTTSYVQDPVFGHLGGSAEARSTFTYLGKLFINLVNGTTPREEYLQPFAGLLKEYQQGMDDFISKIIARGTLRQASVSSAG